MQVDDEGHRLKQQSRLEARDVGAVAAPHVEHTDDFERLHGLTHRVAGQPEALAELLLGGSRSPGASSPEMIMSLILTIASSVTAMR